MIHPIDTPIEFEVSIGNYGNKLDTNVPAQSSTTPPSNPLFDGRQYHYLPWFEQKPCVVVDSQWEDCTFRITYMNILYSMADKLVRYMHVQLNHCDLGLFWCYATMAVSVEYIQQYVGGVVAKQQHDFVCGLCQLIRVSLVYEANLDRVCCVSVFTMLVLGSHVGT